MMQNAWFWPQFLAKVLWTNRENIGILWPQRPKNVLEWRVGNLCFVKKHKRI